MTFKMTVTTVKALRQVLNGLNPNTPIRAADDKPVILVLKGDVLYVTDEEA